MRTHSITLDDETSRLAKDTRNFSQFVRDALRAAQDGSSITVAELTNRRRLALALYAVDCISNDHENGSPNQEAAEMCRNLILDLMKIA